MKLKKFILISALFVSLFVLTLFSKETLIKEDWHKGYTPVLITRFSDNVFWSGVLTFTETLVGIAGVNFDINQGPFLCCLDSYKSDGCNFGAESFECRQLADRKLRSCELLHGNINSLNKLMTAK